VELSSCPILQEIYRIKLPGPPILGEGKPENQNHAIIFTRGEALQAIDVNQVPIYPYLSHINHRTAGMLSSSLVVDLSSFNLFKHHNDRITTWRKL
jgi:hypothetical protein